MKAYIFPNITFMELSAGDVIRTSGTSGEEYSGDPAKATPDYWAEKILKLSKQQ